MNLQKILLLFGWFKLSDNGRFTECFQFPLLCHDSIFSFVSGACVCHVLLVSCDAAKVAVYFGEHLICRLFYFSQILDGAPYIQKRCVVWRLQDLALFVANGEWYSVLQKRHLCTCK